MIVAQAELDTIGPPFRRRMLRLPAERSACPFRRGGVYRLQPKAFAKGQVTVTVSEDPRCEALDAITLEDAKREGFGTVDGALTAWRRAHGRARNQRVWVITFACGDHSRFFEQDAPVYLSKYGDYTTLPGRQAVPGDPEAVFVPGASERARVMAIARRTEPQHGSINRATRDIETLRESLTTMRARNRAKLIAKELAKLQAEVARTEQPAIQALAAAAG